MVNSAVPPVVIAGAAVSSAQNSASVAAMFLSRKFEASLAVIIFPVVFAGALMTAESALSGQVMRFSVHKRQRFAGILEGR